MRKITEFQCIMPIANVPSVMLHGILCNEEAAKLEHESVAMEEVQAVRHDKEVPGGLLLHQYANLYFHARNPMLYKRRAERDSLCILRVDSRIGRSAGVVFTDGNAGSRRYQRFFGYSEIKQLPFEEIYCTDWNHPNPREKSRLKFHKCAEILVPERVPPEMIYGALVANESAKYSLAGLGFSGEITIDSPFFFL
jgi:hypothetical protein